MAIRRRTTTGRRMASRSTSTNPPKTAVRTFTFTSDEIRSIKIIPGRRKPVPKKRSGVIEKRDMPNPPPPPPPLTIEVKLKPK